MSLKIIAGTSGSGKSTYITKWVSEEAVSHPELTYFVIVPDQFTMQTQKDFVNSSPNGGILNIEVLSFSRLAYRIFEETGGARKPVLDDTGKNLILRKCAVDVKDHIPYLAGKLDKPGYIHEVKSALSEFMQYGVGSEELEGLIRYSGDGRRQMLAKKLGDLSVLYDAFQSYIKEKYITTEESLSILSEEIYKSKVISDGIVILDGFTGFTPIQRDVIGALMDVCKEVILTLTIDKDTLLTESVKEQNLFAFTKKTYDSISALAPSHDCEIEVPVFCDLGARYSEAGELAHLEKSLFRYPLQQFDGVCKAISVSSADDLREEVLNMIRQIRQLVRDGAYYRDIAVVTGNLNAYSSEIVEKCDDYDIPVYIDETKEIVLNPFVEYIRSVLNMIIKDYSYESVFQYLRTGFTGINRDDVDRLENYVIETGIRGKSSYYRIFTRKTRDEADHEVLNAIRECMIKELEAFEEAGITKDKRLETRVFVKSLYNFLVNNHSMDKLATYESRFHDASDYSREKEYSQIYGKTMILLEQIEELIGDEVMSLKDFYGILDAGFSEIEVGTLPQSVDRIIVGDMERTRLKPVKYLFFLGLNDGWVPKSGNKGGIISDNDREFLAGSSVELAPSPRNQMYIGRFYLYSNLTKPSHKLYLSHCIKDLQGEAMIPSSVLSQISSLFPTAKIQKAGIAETNGSMQDEILSYESVSEIMQDYAALTRDYAAGNLENEKEQQLLILDRYLSSYKSDTDYVEKIINNAFFRHSDESLDKRIAGILYGTRLFASVNRMETYAKCAYSYFLKYGLGLKTREEYGVEAADMGNIYHGVLEIFIEMLKEKDLDWFSFSEEDAKELVDAAVEKEARVYTDAILFESSKNLYIVERMKSVMLRTVMTLAYQLRKSTFKPLHYEYEFSRVQSIDQINLGHNTREQMTLRGKIDRLDVSEQGDKVYVKIVDYKSGRHDFSLMSFYQGVTLQMVVYMNEAVRAISKSYPDKEIVPAALLYYHIDDPMVDASAQDSIEAIEDKIRKELRTKGLVGDSDDIIASLDTSKTPASDVIPVKRKTDGSFTKESSVVSSEDMEIISKYADYKLLNLAGRMIEGDIAVDPLEIKSSPSKTEMDSCMYCDYKNVCGFDEHMPGYEKKHIGKMEDVDLISQMKSELEEGGML